MVVYAKAATPSESFLPRDPDSTVSRFSHNHYDLWALLFYQSFKRIVSPSLLQRYLKIEHQKSSCCPFFTSSSGAFGRQVPVASLPFPGRTPAERRPAVCVGLREESACMRLSESVQIHCEQIHFSQ
jgi:hypothetical protein